MRHLTVQQISGSLDGALSGVSLELVVRHLSSCHECRERHARLTKQDDALRRLLACEFSDVFFDDMLARLGAVLEAESRGQMPPEHALPPELPPLGPDKPPSREMARPSAAMRNPALPSEEEQKRRAAEELKAAEAAAMNSLEELMREMREARGVASAKPESAPESGPPDAASSPASILQLPPEILASLRDAAAAMPEVPPARKAGPVRASEPEPRPEPVRASEPVPRPEPIRETEASPDRASEPEPWPEPSRASEPEPRPEQEPIRIVPVGEDPVDEPRLEPAMHAGPVCSSPDEGPFAPVRDSVSVDDELPIRAEQDPPALQWEVIEGPLPVGPDFGTTAESAAEPEPRAHRTDEYAAAPTTLPQPEPEPVPEPAPEPARWSAPARPVEPARSSTPSTRPGDGREPAAAEPARSPAQLRHSRQPNPVDDPYADYEERLEQEPPESARHRPAGRRLRKRHIVGAAVAVTALLMALAGSGYLPAVIRVPLPQLPRPRVPRIEVVRVPLASTQEPARDPQDETLASTPEGTRPVVRTAPSPSGEPRVVRPNRAGSAAMKSESPAASAPKPVAPPVRESVAESRPAPVRTPVPTPVTERPTPPTPAASTPAPVRAASPTPVQTTPPAPVQASRPAPAEASPTRASETEATDSASWPLLCGIVLDETGAPVAGARVTLADLDLGARTDRRGRFCVAAPPGDRTLSVVATGFVTSRRVVSLGTENLEVSIPLTPAP
ncbi:MAG: carboxypeptidase regulatory-like domain-containing protein [Candidatus Eisenbacteria bacterium]|nr:carboxypeptidase regulatory-like domain-containing protein [Candidatus Eisenbacteria bacterium]